MHGRRRIAILLTCCGLASAAVAQNGPADQIDHAASLAPAPGDIKTADQLLDALQTADRDLVSLTADVKWDRTFELQGDQQSRLGKLYYEVVAPARADQPPDRRFAIHFNQLWVSGVERPEDHTYIFDGQWMMDKDAIGKFYQKRQVAPPGQHVDPLELGQGPIAIPIGQRKEDILKRYTAELLPPSAGLDAPQEAGQSEKEAAARLKAAVEGAWQLHLIPKPEFAHDEDFTDIRLWYKRGADGAIMPRMARTVNKQGDVSNVLLINDQVQRKGQPTNAEAAVPPAVMDTAVPQGWDGSTVDWRGHGSMTGQAPSAPEGSH